MSLIRRIYDHIQPKPPAKRPHIRQHRRRLLHGTLHQINRLLTHARQFV